MAANTGAARTGTITAGGQTFTINQAAGSGTVPRRTQFDFDGDGKADVSVFRPDGGVWYLMQSTSGLSSTQFGLATDLPAAADYDGDGRTDIAVFRSGTWFLDRSTQGFRGISTPTEID